jgi:hypothetical protein
MYNILKSKRWFVEKCVNNKLTKDNWKLTIIINDVLNIRQIEHYA